MNLTKVVVQNGNVDLALKKFKAKVARSGVPSEIKKENTMKNRALKEEMKLKKELKTHIKEIEANNVRKN